MEKKLRVRNIPVTRLLDILEELEECGIEFIDIIAKQGEQQDTIVFVKDDGDNGEDDDDDYDSDRLDEDYLNTLM